MIERKSFFLANRASLAKSRLARRSRWEFEPLEERRMLTTVLTVNTTNDTADANDEKSAKDSAGHISLRSAIQYANNNQGPFVIDLPNNLGVFDLTQGAITVGNGAYGVDLNITVQGVTSSGAAADPSTVVIDQTTQARIFVTTNPPHGLQLLFANMTVEGGQTPTNDTDGGSAFFVGGSNASATTINNCIIQNNVSHNGPGAVVLNDGGSLTVTNTAFTNNSTTGTSAFGAAISFDNLGTASDGTNSSGNFTVTNCTFTGNVAADTGGSAIEADQYKVGGTMAITDCSFINNSVLSAAAGGGGAVEMANGNLSVTGCVFVGNTSNNGINGVAQWAGSGGSGVITCSNDWWGDNNFPDAGSAEDINGDVNVVSRLQIALVPDVTTISTNSSTGMLAEILSVVGTSVGTQPVAGTALTGMNVAFGAGSLAGAAVSPTIVPLGSNGVAISAFISGSTPGNAAPTVQLNSAITSTPILVEQAPQVTTQPTSEAVLAGQTVTFTAQAATGFPAPTAQWQVSTDNGASYSNLSNGSVGSVTYSGTTTDTLTVTNPTTSISGYLFRVVYTNVAGVATSNAAELTAITITLTPSSLPVAEVGDSFSQTLTASGGVAPYSFALVSGSLPTGLTLQGNGLLSGTPTVNGQYTFTVEATDSSTPNAFPGDQTYTLTVDQPPSITSGASETFTEGIAGTFAITTGSDFPTATSLSETGALPSGVTFVDNGNGTATLAGTPAFGTSATYNLVITAANGVGPNATQNFVLTVQPALQISSASHDTLTVGTTGTFSISTLTLLGSTPSLTESGSLPSGVTFVDNGNGTATLHGDPAVGSGGTYLLTITAANGTAPNAVQSFTLTIDEAPTITSVDGATFTVGAVGAFTVTTAHDFPGATTLTETGALPAGVTFVDNGNGTATLAGTPSSGAGGVYTLTVTANNGVAPNATQTFTLTVDEAPTFTSANNDAFAMVDANSFEITTGHDYPAGTTLSESGALPSGVTFVDNGNGTATLAGTPAAGTGGAYAISFTAANGISPNATQSFILNVDLTPTFTVGDVETYTVLAPYELPSPTTLSETGALPNGVTFVDNGNGTATLAGTPTTATGGTYTLTITATTGGTTATETLVLSIDEAPTIASVNNATFLVGTAGSFTVAEGVGFPAPTFTESGTLPAGVTFVDNGNGTATLSGTPAVGTGGVYTFTITASNSTAPNATQSFTLTVDEAPTITSADATTFTVGDAGSFAITTAHDYPAGTTLSESGALPSGVTFIDNGNGTATLAGTPAATTGGTYTLTITAANGISPNATQTLTLTIDEAPTIASVNHATFTVGSAGSFTVAEGVGFPAPAFTESGALPSGVTFVDNGNGTATLAGTPAVGAGGVYHFTITAANNTTPNATQNFTLTVDEAPTISSANATTFTVGAAGTFTITTAHDYPAATTLSESGALPSGVTFVDNGNGTATLAGTPAVTTGGAYTLTITAANGISPNATQTLTLTIDEAPTIASADNATFTVGTAGSFSVTTNHDFPVATTLSETGALPSGVTFVDNGNGTATLAGTPAVGAGGQYTFTITAANGVAPDATQSFTLTIDEAPTITSGDSETFFAGASSNFTVTTAHDYPTATTLSESGSLPSGVTFVDNGDGTATLSGVPDTSAVGVYSVTVTASNGISPEATQTFTLTVSLEADLAVSIASSSSSSIAGGTVTYTVVVSNSGPSPSQNVTLGLPFAGEPVAVLSQSQLNGPTFALNSTSSQIADTLSSLAAGQSATFNIVVLVNSNAANGSIISSAATVTSSTYDPSPSNNTSTSNLFVVNGGMVAIPDPFNAALTDLVIGTSPSGNDSVVVNSVGGGAVSVTLDGRFLGSYQPSGRLVIYAGSGNDALTVSQDVDLPAFLYAGSGNDALTGGSGDNVLVGGSGRDVLTGGPGQNIEIAGSGLSRLSYVAGGPSGGSLLIGGTTVYDQNDAALEAIFQEWTSTSIPFATRVAALRSGVDGVMLNSSTVALSSVADQLFGSSADQDWFMSVPGGKTSGVLNASSDSQIN